MPAVAQVIESERRSPDLQRIALELLEPSLLQPSAKCQMCGKLAIDLEGILSPPPEDLQVQEAAP